MVLLCYSRTTDPAVLLCYSRTTDPAVLLCYSRTTDPVVLLCYSRTTDPAVLLCYSRTTDPAAQSLGRKPETERDRDTPCFLFRYRDILPKKTHSHEWMELSEGDVSMFISTVASLHGVYVKPLDTKVCVPQLFKVLALTL